MRVAHPRRIQIYRAPNGQAPYIEWFDSIRDLKTITQIESRIDRIESGNLGDYKPVGDGVFELRFRSGPGYRIYFGQVGNTIVLLLCGGDKSSQRRDIERAKAYWQEYKETST